VSILSTRSLLLLTPSFLPHDGQRPAVRVPQPWVMRVWVGNCVLTVSYTYMVWKSTSPLTWPQAHLLFRICHHLRFETCLFFGLRSSVSVGWHPSRACSTLVSQFPSDQPPLGYSNKSSLATNARMGKSEIPNRAKAFRAPFISESTAPCRVVRRRETRIRSQLNS
jgi:hypothetical protein